MPDEKQESLNEFTNRWNNCRIKDTSQDPYIWFNDIFNLSLKFKNIKAKYDKDGYDLKAHIFDVLPEDYKPMILSCYSNISKMEFKDLRREISWCWKTELNGNKTQGKNEPEEKVI